MTGLLCQNVCGGGYVQKKFLFFAKKGLTVKDIFGKLRLAVWLAKKKE
jgi:hypothetical protein